MGIATRKVIFLLGPPGSGKTSQGTALAPLLDGQHVSAGELVRQALAAGEKIPRDASQPALADPGWMVDRIDRQARDARVLLVDGFPRSAGHLAGLSSLGSIQGAIRLTISFEEAIDRMRSRQRAGETLARIASRWNQHRNRDQAVVKALEGQAISLIEVDGHGELEVVTQRLQDAARRMLGWAEGLGRADPA